MRVQKAHGLLTESRLSDHSDDLRSRLKRDGYLFFRSFFDPAILNRARAKALQLSFKMGFLERSYETGEATLRSSIIESGLDPEQSRHWKLFGPRFSKTQISRTICGDKKLENQLKRIFGGPPVIHPMKHARWARLHFPEAIYPSMKIHQDNFYVGLPLDTYSVWIPLGDCPRFLGGLAILKGSHKLGVLRHKKETHEIVLPRRAKSMKWLSADFTCGDILIFHSCTVHGPLPNRTVDTLRMAYDLRFCKKALIAEAVLNHPRYGKF